MSELQLAARRTFRAGGRFFTPGDPFPAGLVSERKLKMLQRFSKIGPVGVKAKPKRFRQTIRDSLSGVVRQKPAQTEQAQASTTPTAPMWASWTDAKLFRYVQSLTGKLYRKRDRAVMALERYHARAS